MFSGVIIGDGDRKSWDARGPICVCSVEKSYVRKLFTPGWYQVNLRVSQTMLNHNQNLFLTVFACLASLQKFLKGKSDA